MSKGKETAPTGEALPQWDEVTAGAFIKWETVGQTIEGTLMKREKQESRLNPGKFQMIYTILLADGTQVRFSKGNIGDKSDISPRIERLKIGQYLRLIYAKEIPSPKKGYQPFKAITVQTNGLMNEAWLNAQQLDVAALDFA